MMSYDINCDVDVVIKHIMVKNRVYPAESKLEGN